MESQVKGAWRELFHIVRLRQTSTQTRRSIIASAISLANIFLCAFFERYVIGPGWREALASLLAIETGILITLAMAIHLQIIDPILKRTEIHPLDHGSRFTFVAVTLLRHRYIVLFWASAVFSMTMMVHPVLASIPSVVFCFVLPGVALVVISATLLVMFARWTSSGAVALAVLGIIASVTTAATIVFPESHTLELLMPLRWCTLSCAAALAGNYGASVLNLSPFILLAALAWIGGSRYA
jgi:hypothetical protein